MKTKFSALMLCLVSFATLHAQSIDVQTKSGGTFYGELLSHTDTTLTVKDNYTFRTSTIPAKLVESAKFSNGDCYVVEDGKFVLRTKAEIKAFAQAEEQKRMGNPNYAIGKAMKQSGSFAIGFGVPCLLTGTILCIVGNKGPKTEDYKDVTSIEKALNVGKKYTYMTTAGCILAGSGSALTLVGIPLVVKGKKIMQMQLQVSENGAGVAINL